MWSRRPLARLLLASAFVAVVALRFLSAGPLWFDEAQSIAIARLPVHALFGALRQDGSPPVYYLLLHGWLSVAGSGTWAVRALSGLFSLAELPAAWLLARRVLPRNAVWPATALVATSPFVIRYATETRMYALVLLLVTLGGLALVRVLERPGPSSVTCLALAAGALALTHYWALFLLAVVGIQLLARALAGERKSWSALAGLGGGGLLFLPWLPSLLFQIRHTGTPWSHARWYDVLVAFPAWAGAERVRLAPLVPATGLFLLLLVLIGLGLRHSASARPLFVLSAGTLALAGAVSVALGSAADPRYTTVALLPCLFVAALGVASLSPRIRLGVLVASCILGLVGGCFAALTPRTLAGRVAAQLQSHGSPTDVVVYCPDQVGVDVARLLPDWHSQEMFPTGLPPERVDWVDYESRNIDADPTAFADWLLASAGSAPIWLLYSGGFREYHGRCGQLAAALARLRPARQTFLTGVNPMEQSQIEKLVRYQPPPWNPGTVVLTREK